MHPNMDPMHPIPNGIIVAKSSSHAPFEGEDSRFSSSTVEAMSHSDSEAGKSFVQHNL
jgi:hypothetical protein